MVERPGLRGGLFLAGMGLDGDFEGGEVAVDPAVLNFFLLVDLPARLPGDAEAGVVENEDELAPFLQRTMDILKDL